MKKIFFVIFLLLPALAFAGQTFEVSAVSGASTVWDSLVPDAAETPLEQSSAGAVFKKVVYNSSVIFEKGKNSDKVALVEINPLLGTLSVTFTPDANATYYSAEIWALTDGEAADFANWSPNNSDASKDKEKKRAFQFILSQGSMAKGAEKTVSVNLAGAIDKSDSANYPARTEARCVQKYAWLGGSTAENCKPANISNTWNKFTFEKFFDYASKSTGKKFYLVVETSAKPGDSGAWKDSVPMKLSIAKKEAVSGECSTIAECKALLDLKFVEQIFKKKNLTETGAETSSAGFCSLTREITADDVLAYFGMQCASYFDLVKKYSGQNGLKELGIDELLLFSLIKTESNCNPNASAGGGKGLMQLTKDGIGERYDALKVFEPGYNIDEGTRHLYSYLLHFSDEWELSTGDTLILYLFSYNRGTGTADLAGEYYSAGESLDDAMYDSCTHFYSIGSYGGCAGFDQSACCGREGKYCTEDACVEHSGYGLGASYPEKILKYYADACEKAGGKIA